MQSLDVSKIHNDNQPIINERESCQFHLNARSEITEVVSKKLATLKEIAQSLNSSEKIIIKLNQFETEIVDRIPNILNTDLLDTISDKAEGILKILYAKLKPLQQFNQWLDTNELQQTWDSNLKLFAVFLTKLPARAIRNIVSMLVNMIKAAMYATVHPAKAVMKLAKLIVKMAEELTKPETWSKIGAGIIGASLGQTVVGNPLSIISLIVVLVIIAGGITTGAILAALKVETGDILTRAKAAGHEIRKQVEQLPESMLTSFCIGLLVGGYQKQTFGNPVDEAVKAYVKEHNVTNPDWIWTEAKDHISKGVESLYTPIGENEVIMVWLNKFITKFEMISDIQRISYIPNPSSLPSLVIASIANAELASEK
jgi:hypothetical protein